MEKKQGMGFALPYRLSNLHIRGALVRIACGSHRYQNLVQFLAEAIGDHQLKLTYHMTSSINDRGGY